LGNNCSKFWEFVFVKVLCAFNSVSFSLNLGLPKLCETPLAIGIVCFYKQVLQGIMAALLFLRQTVAVNGENG